MVVDEDVDAGVLGVLADAILGSVKREETAAAISIALSAGVGIADDSSSFSSASGGAGTVGCLTAPRELEKAAHDRRKAANATIRTAVSSTCRGRIAKSTSFKRSENRS